MAALPSLNSERYDFGRVLRIKMDTSACFYMERTYSKS